MIQFTVLGEPVGKSRPKFSTFNGHAMAYTPQKTVNYETLVKLSYQQQCNDKPYEKDIPLRAEITAYFPIPKSASMKRKKMMLEGQIRHTKKCDSDNLAKAVLDALNGIAYYDDSQVCELSVSKLYSDNPRVIVSISEI
jgi:Holliday junction resolvase RusA-like endonuclease